MFGQNAIVGQKFFEGKDKLLVTSVFYTLQGEGPFAGRPAVFVRVAHCNLACSFCDTYFDNGDWMDPHELYEAWLRVTNQYLKRTSSLLDKILVITGGEPMLQPVLREVVLIGLMYFDKVQIETNGLQLLVGFPRNVYLVVSPKCTEGVGAHYLKPPERVLERANCLKFVISHDPKSSYHTIPGWAFEWRDATKKPVYVSPMNVYTRKPDRGVCKSCGGSGFSGQGTGYGDVCSECGGQRHTNDMESRSRAERVSFWEPGLLHLDHVRANHEYAAQYCLDHSLYLSIQMQLFAVVP